MRIVIALEYGGMTIGRSNWMAFGVHRLHGLQQLSDPWPSGPPENAPHFELTVIEAAVDDRWGTLQAGSSPPLRHQPNGEGS
jgi:hypothetical protein